MPFIPNKLFYIFFKQLVPFLSSTKFYNLHLHCNKKHVIDMIMYIFTHISQFILDIK